MFGHKDGKVEKMIDAIVIALDAAEQFAKRGQKEETLSQIENARDGLKTIKSLSRKIHNLVEAEL